MKNTLTLLVCFFIPLMLSSQIYNDYIGAGHDEGVIVSSSSQENDNKLTVNGSGIGKDLIGASRFMSHATLGASLDELLYVDSIGYEAWMDEQFDLPASSYSDVLEAIDNIVYDIYLELGGVPEDYFTTAQQFRFTWSHIAQTAPDVLRHRIALALSEILVISTDSDLFQSGFGVASYYDVLSENAFGNYKDLLMDVTLHPTMGFYLSHLNNQKSDPVNNIHPDENYAREIMQLFSIGLFELNPDGSLQLDNDGDYIPTYDNVDIKGLAKVFTGLGMSAWIDPDIPDLPQFGIPFFYIDPTSPMFMWEFFHEPGEKTIVGDFTIPAGQTGMQDIEMAVDHLFNHQNVGPFIGTRLIQRLVKSNPTPGYVERITNVFNDNGDGVRGDLKAVVKAILLDPEARDCIWINNSTNGKLKEPIQRYTQYVKGLRAETEAEWFWNQGFAFDYFTDQFPMHSPSVFNFFLPDYQPNSVIADQGMVAPEFQIFNSSTSIGYFNILYYMAIAEFNNELPEEELNQLGILEDYQANLVIPDLEEIGMYPEAVVDYLDLVLAHGNMSEETRDVIIASCDPLIDYPDFLVKMALYLTMVSPDFVIMR
jgi:uncharacterized protein (DUF1800 family)